MPVKKNTVSTKLLFFVFSVLNIFIYIIILLGHDKISFNRENYDLNSHHYYQDQRVNGGDFNLLRAMGQFDSQWYLRIAEKGYPQNPIVSDLKDKSAMDGLSYAFFPLYPIVLKFTNHIFGNIELTAFVLSIILLLTNFVVLQKTLKESYKNLAVKTSFLLFFFPFSIFFRAYYAEGLFLLLLSLFSYFWIKQRYFLSSFFLSLINVTKANGFLLIPVYLVYLFRLLVLKKIRLSVFIIHVFIAVFPLGVWVMFNYYKTGNLLYFVSVQSQWAMLGKMYFLQPLYNLLLVFSFPILPLHGFHFSKIDALIVVASITILFMGRKLLEKKHLIVAICLWASPLLVHDTISFSRFQAVSFPLFVYLASILKGKLFISTLAIFYILLLLTSLFFVNWYWIG